MRDSETKSEAITFLVSAAFWITVFAITCCACVLRATISRGVAEQEFAATSLTISCGGRAAAASGVAVGGPYILTAAHVVAWCLGDEIKVTSTTGLEWTSTTASVDRVWLDRDVARLKMSPTLGSTRAARAAPIVTEFVCVLAAHPSREHNCGIVEQVYGKSFTFGARVLHGNSGSGVYDQQGALVGILTKGSFDPQGEPLGTGWAALVTSEMLP